MLEDDLRTELLATGSTDVDIEPVWVYSGADLECMAGDWRSAPPHAATDTQSRDELDGAAVSAFIRATRSA